MSGSHFASCQAQWLGIVSCFRNWQSRFDDCHVRPVQQQLKEKRTGHLIRRCLSAPFLYSNYGLLPKLGKVISLFSGKIWSLAYVRGSEKKPED
jgi:hypothetical protein